MADLDVSEITRAIEKIIGPTKRVTAAIKEMQEGYGKAAKAANSLVQSTDKLSQSQEILTSKIGNTTRALTDGTSGIGKSIVAVVSFVADLVTIFFPFRKEIGTAIKSTGKLITELRLLSGVLLATASKSIGKMITKLRSLSGAMLATATKGIRGLIVGLRSLSGAMLATATKGIRGLIVGLRSLSIAMLSIPVVGWIIAGITLAAFLIYKFWDRIKEFVGGVIGNFKSAAAPIMEALKPIQPVFDAIGNSIGWVVDAVKALFSPVQDSTEELGKAAEAGRKFGEWLAEGIAILLTPITWLLEKLQTINDYLGVTDKLSSVFSWGKSLFSDEKENPAKKITKNAKQMGKIASFSEGDAASTSLSGSEQKPLRVAQSQTNETTVNANITVHAAPGMNEKEVAIQVGAILKERERQAKAQQRAALYDFHEVAHA